MSEYLMRAGLGSLELKGYSISIQRSADIILKASDIV